MLTVFCIAVRKSVHLIHVVMKRIFLLLTSVLVLGCWMRLHAEPVVLKYAERDTCSLYMDMYEPENPNGYTFVYVFGGGFLSGSRNKPYDVRYFEALSEKGFRVFSIDYRLGLKGVRLGALPVKPLERAIDMAVEDLYSALSYIAANSESLGVDTDRIILAGSSAGAITVLQADYMLANRTGHALQMPADFRFAGVVSFSGAVFSRKGRPRYRVHPPSPTCFFHGKEDRLVPYGSIRLFNIGFFGTGSLVRSFGDCPHAVTRYEGLGHEVAGFSMKCLEETMSFFRSHIEGHSRAVVDCTVSDPDIERTAMGAMKPSDLSRLED